MKKWIGFIIGLLIILGLLETGAAYYIGIKTQQRFEALVLFLNDNHFAPYKIIDYQRGIFKSTVITTVKIDPLTPDKIIKVKNTVYHGPIILNQDNKPLDFQLASIKSEPLEISIPMLKIPFTTITKFKFNGETETKTKGSAFEIKGELYQVTGPSWSTTAIIDKNLVGVVGDFIIPEIHIQAMGLPISIRDIRFEIHQSRSPYGAWLGDASLKVGDAVQNEKSIKIDHLKLEEGAEFVNQAVNVMWGLEFNKISVAMIDYGPLRLKMQISNLDPEGLKLLASIQPENPSLQTGTDSQAKAKQEAAFQKILLKRPKFSILPSYITIPPGGSFQGNIQVDAEMAMGGASITIPVSKDDIIKTMDGYFHALVPKDILRHMLMSHINQALQQATDYPTMTEEQKKEALEKQINLKIQRLITDGILTEKENAYDVKISIAQGKWLSNGKEVDKPY